MSWVDPPSYGRTRWRAEPAEEDPFHTRILQSERPEDSPLLKSPAGSRSPSPPRGRNDSRSSRGGRTSSNVSEQRDYILDLANPEREPLGYAESRRQQKHTATFQCTLCPEKFTRAYNLRSHLRTHTEERPFVCTVCGKAFARQHDRKRHEGLHAGEKKFVCRGDLQGSISASWGCGRRFARVEALGRHFKSEVGRVCIKPLFDEENAARWEALRQELARQRAARQEQWLTRRLGLVLDTPQPMMATSYHNPMDDSLPTTLLQQYPALAGMDWYSSSQGPPPDEEVYSGQSDFDAGASGGDSQDDLLDPERSSHVRHSKDWLQDQSFDNFNSVQGLTRFDPPQATHSRSIDNASTSPLGTDNHRKDLDHLNSKKTISNYSSSVTPSPFGFGDLSIVQPQSSRSKHLDPIATVTTNMLSHYTIPPHMNRRPIDPSPHGLPSAQRAGYQKFGHVDGSLATSGSFDSSSAAYPKEVVVKWLDVEEPRAHRRASFDEWTSYASSTNPPASPMPSRFVNSTDSSVRTEEQFNRVSQALVVEHSQPTSIVGPSTVRLGTPKLQVVTTHQDFESYIIALTDVSRARDHASPRGFPDDEQLRSNNAASSDASRAHTTLGSGQAGLIDGHSATQNFYTPGHIPPRLVPQQNIIPAFTADNNFGMTSAYSGQSIQPNDGPEMFPSYGEESFPSYGPTSPSDLASATPSQQSEIRTRDLQVVPIVVEDASHRHSSDDGHSLINAIADCPNSDVLLADPLWSHKARSVELNDPSAARTEVSVSTVQTVLEDASTSNADSGSNDYDQLALSESPHEEELVASDLDEPDLTRTVAGPSLARTATSNFGEARLELERLRLGIETLEDSSESSSDISRSEPDIQTDIHHSPQVETEPDVSSPIKDNEEGSESHHGDPGSSCIDAGGSRVTDTSPSAQGNGRKRQRSHNADDGVARTEVCVDEKRSRLPCKRFICCFHKEPGRECPGTDETTSEVLKKLSEHHDTHVCDRCWVLKVKDKPSGRLVHADCVDHCLSPQCHKTTPTIGHRHKFDRETCGGRKTSRVRPGDGEAVYRFIFSLVHPTLESPAEVVTAEHSLHLGAVPRQGRRKATREELTAQADLLGERLEDLENRHAERTGEIDILKQQLQDAHSTIVRDREKTATLEAKMRRVVAILGDALRTGEFRDQQGHRSLLMRVGEDAPDALSLLSQPSLSPPDSTSGQHPSFMPTWEKTNAAEQCQLFQDAYPMNPNSVAFDKTPHGSSYGTWASQQATTDMSLGDQNMNIDWLNLLDEPKNPSIASAYMDDLS
jgi:hypothetical protein